MTIGNSVSIAALGACAALWASTATAQIQVEDDPFGFFELSTGTGDGTASVTVDGFGRIDSAIYDPLGDIGPASVIFDGDVRITNGNFVDALGDVAVNNDGAQVIDGSLVSEFEVGLLGFRVTQTISQVIEDGQIGGSILDQTFAIRNLADVGQTFSLYRYLDGDLAFDGSIQDGGGVIGSGEGRVLFETDASGGASDQLTFLGINATGGLGSADPNNRFEIAPFSSGNLNLPLNDNVFNDTDGDGFVDTPFDVTLQLRNGFQLAAAGQVGSTQTYVTRTLFGTGAPEDVDTGGGVTNDGTSEVNPLLPEDGTGGDGPVGGADGFAFDIDQDVFDAFGLDLQDFIDNPTLITPVIFIDPVVATGYTYEVSGAAFASVTAPTLATVPDADGFTLVIGDKQFALAAGETVIFSDILDPGLPPVDVFQIIGIDPDLGLDPEDDLAFVTGISLTGFTGSATVTQTAIRFDTDTVAPVPLPAGGLLLVGGLAGLGALRRRRRASTEA